MWYAATAARSVSRIWSRARAPRRRSAACGADAAMGATPQVDVPHVDVPHVDVAVVGGGIAGLWLLARLQIGRAHVCTPVTNAHLVCRLLLEKKKEAHIRT